MTERAARKVTPEQIAVARGAFIMGDETLGQISERYYIPRGTLQRYARNEDWREQRDKWREKQRQFLEATLREDVVRSRLQTIRDARVVQEKVFATILRGIDEGTLRPTVTDYVNLVKTIRTLEEPGWDKPTSSEVNVTVNIDNVLERVRETRSAIDTDAQIEHIPNGIAGMAPADANFLLEGGDEE